jgi:hypothetical protein
MPRLGVVTLLDPEIDARLTTIAHDTSVRKRGRITVYRFNRADFW